MEEMISVMGSPPKMGVQKKLPAKSKLTVQKH